MESGPVCRPGSRPRMLMCYLCGREYGTRSLPIHIPQCQKKWLLDEENKPKNERRSLPSQPNAEKAIRNGGAQAFDNFNTEAFAAFEQTLKQCPYCQRRFLPKPFLRHRKGCTAANPAKPAGTGLIPISLTNRLVPGAVAGSMHGKANQRPFKVSFFPHINNRLSNSNTRSNRILVLELSMCHCVCVNLQKILTRNQSYHQDRHLQGLYGPMRNIPFHSMMGTLGRTRTGVIPYVWSLGLGIGYQPPDPPPTKGTEDYMVVVRSLIWWIRLEICGERTAGGIIQCLRSRGTRVALYRSGARKRRQRRAYL